jgi:hypothetical protein
MLAHKDEREKRLRTYIPQDTNIIDCYKLIDAVKDWCNKENRLARTLIATPLRPNRPERPIR